MLPGINWYGVDLRYYFTESFMELSDNSMRAADDIFPAVGLLSGGDETLMFCEQNIKSPAFTEP